MRIFTGWSCRVDASSSSGIWRAIAAPTRRSPPWFSGMQEWPSHSVVVQKVEAVDPPDADRAVGVAARLAAGAGTACATGRRPRRRVSEDSPAIDEADVARSAAASWSDNSGCCDGTAPSGRRARRARCRRRSRRSAPGTPSRLPASRCRAPRAPGRARSRRPFVQLRSVLMIAAEKIRDVGPCRGVGDLGAQVVHEQARSPPLCTTVSSVPAAGLDQLAEAARDLHRDGVHEELDLRCRAGRELRQRARRLVAARAARVVGRSRRCSTSMAPTRGAGFTDGKNTTGATSTITIALTTPSAANVGAAVHFVSIRPLADVLLDEEVARERHCERERGTQREQTHTPSSRPVRSGVSHRRSASATGRRRTR